MNHLPADALITHGCSQFAAKPGAPVLRLDDTEVSAWPASVLPFIERTVKWGNQPLGIMFGGAEHPDEMNLAQFVHHYYQRASVQQKTVQKFSADWARNFCRTLKRSPSWATSLDQPWLGRPAFVVAAGPSLDKNGHLLAECQKRGPVLAVNTSLPACQHYGVTPDLVLCAEALNVSNHLKTSAGIVTILDAVAGQENWDAADDPLAITWNEPNLVPYVLACGAIPLNYRVSVACGAVSLALLWGASPVVLIGQDCAYTELRVYAQGTEWGDMRAEVCNDGAALKFTGGKQGTDKELHPLPLVPRPAWGGVDMVPSSHDMEILISWLEGAARRHYVINATEGGAHIEGTYERTLSEVLGNLPIMSRASRPKPPPCDTSKLCDHLRRRAERFLAERDVMPPVDFPIINMWAISTLIDPAPNPLVRVENVRAAMETGCVEILEVLS